MCDTAQRKKILIIDDDPSVHVLLHAALQDSGLNVTAATRLGSAEETLGRDQFDLVLADINLGGILATEGLELLSFIKRYWPRTRVLIMTGLGSPEMRLEAFKRGADYYVEKPFDIAEIQKIAAPN